MVEPEILAATGGIELAEQLAKTAEDIAAATADATQEEVLEHLKMAFPKRVVPTAEDMPDWWPEGKPPEKLREGFIYRGRGGRWYYPNGVIVSRAQRRRAGVK
jgi:hypothetical protein